MSSLRMWFLILGVLSLPLLLAAMAIGLNRPPLFESPGASVRLGIYLRENVAATSDDHQHAELRTPTFAVGAEQLHEHVLQAMKRLKWQAIRKEGDLLRAEVVTPLLHFVDDIEVRIEAVEGRTQLHLRSVSRVGRADFAANQRHILDLLESIRAEISP